MPALTWIGDGLENDDELEDGFEDIEDGDDAQESEGENSSVREGVLAASDGLIAPGDVLRLFSSFELLVASSAVLIVKLSLYL